jgi:transposase
MTKPYPIELRQRAVRFVKGGESRHEVARRLGVSVSCVVKWLLRHKATGSVKPGKVGGHRPRKIVGEHRDWVLAEIASGGNVTLQGLVDGLARRGVKVDYRTMWNFVHREGKSFKKKRFMAMSRHALTLRDGEGAGASTKAGSTSADWSSSMRHGQRPTWRRCVAGARAASG